jgi:hypothetical protein
MVAVHVFATPNAEIAHAWSDKGRLGVALYHRGGRNAPGLGQGLAESVRRDLPAPPSEAAWDFLSIALGVFAADRFVLRSQAEDGWTRVIHLRVALSNPAAWKGVEERLASAFRFLTGDIWTLQVVEGGERPPQFPPRFNDRDEICLFSGGLDSLLGAVSLLEQGRHPLVVSQGSPKEVDPQVNLAAALGLTFSRFEGRINERWRAPYEPSTRGRSILFFAYAVLAASACGLPRAHVPENGLIAINAPLTRRRIGSLSTRTTHPYFLSEMNDVLASTGVGVELHNMFEAKTKGEMLDECRRADKEVLAARSYSSGKGKRLNKQCGRCIPCLIRRAAVHKAGLSDLTKYYHMDIGLASKHDDVLAARLAVARSLALPDRAFARWVLQAGPLPFEASRKASLVACVRRGIEEISEYLQTIQWR